MIFKLIKLVIPILLINWLISEADLVVPGARDSILNVFNSIQIPTHDSWPAGMTNVKNIKLDQVNEDLQKLIKNYQEGGAKQALNNLGSKAQMNFGNVTADETAPVSGQIFDKKDIFESLKDHQPLIENLR